MFDFLIFLTAQNCLIGQKKNSTIMGNFHETYIQYSSFAIIILADEMPGKLLKKKLKAPLLPKPLPIAH